MKNKLLLISTLFIAFVFAIFVFQSSTQLLQGANYQTATTVTGSEFAVNYQATFPDYFMIAEDGTIVQLDAISTMNTKVTTGEAENLGSTQSKTTSLYVNKIESCSSTTAMKDLGTPFKLKVNGTVTNEGLNESVSSEAMATKMELTTSSSGDTENVSYFTTATKSGHSEFVPNYVMYVMIESSMIDNVIRDVVYVTADESATTMNAIDGMLMDVAALPDCAAITISSLSGMMADESVQTKLANSTNSNYFAGEASVVSITGYV